MILAEILRTKREEVAAARRQRALADLLAAVAAAPAPRDFAGALARGPGLKVIAEVKKASPSKGVIRPDFDPVAIARAYEAAGAACLSVLTDRRYFQGDLAYLEAIRQAVSLPLLRKDFIIDEYQVYEARAAGADAILLIVAAFAGECAEERTPDDLKRLMDLARSQGMAALVEVHTASEVKVALEAGATLVGINNRDLKTFVTSLTVTEALAPLIPRDRLLVSESGIFTPEDAARAAAAGARAVLVGESLMREPDVGRALRRLLGEAV